MRLLCALALLVATIGHAKAVEFEVFQSQARPLAVALLIKAPTESEEALARQVIERDWTMSGALQSLDPLLFVADPEETWHEVVYADWRVIGADALVLVRLEQQQGAWRGKAVVHDPFQMRKLNEVAIQAATLRRAAHQAADAAFAALVGVPGHFASRLYYVRKTKQGSVLVRADADGGEPKTLLGPFELLLSPDATPGGGRLVFTRFANGKPAIELFAGGKLTRIASFPGLNATPALSPDGSKLAATLSLHDNEDIYLYDFASKRWQRLTHSPAIDISPTWSPDGKRLAFVSNREGSPQVFVMELATHKITRISWEGRYNTAPAWSPRGDWIAFVAMKNFHYALAVVHPDGTELRYLATAERIESPCWSPNGWMIAFTVQEGARRGLAVVPVRGGKVHLLTKRSEDASDCTWAWR